MKPDILSFAGRHAKWVMAFGLVAAIVLPSLARFLANWLVPLIMSIMFIGALRLRPDRIAEIIDRPFRSISQVLALQLALPLVAAGLLAAFGLLGTTAAAGIIIALSAPGIVSSPNIAAIMHLDGAAAMRLVGVGTALVPLTCLPPLLILYGPVDLGGVLMAAARLAGILIVAGGLGLLCRRIVLTSLTTVGEQRLDGLSAISLSVFVIALMPAFSETALRDPLTMALWLALAAGLNFGMQIVAFRLAGATMPSGAAGSLALTAGNRNMALFFAALPAVHTVDLLPYLAAYQIPMYLTPLLMSWLYSRRD